MTPETAFHAMIFMAGGSGVLMILGSFFLILKGKLDFATQQEGAAGFDTKIMSFKTRYPALAMFFIGLVFVLNALYLARPGTTLPLHITGRLVRPDPTTAHGLVQVRAEQLETRSDSHGAIVGEFNPQATSLRAVVSVPGYRPYDRVFHASELPGREVNLGSVSLDGPVQERQDVNAGLIEDATDVVPKRAAGTLSDVIAR